MDLVCLGLCVVCCVLCVVVAYRGRVVKKGLPRAKLLVVEGLWQVGADIVLRNMPFLTAPSNAELRP